MTASVLCIGTELCRGEVVNTNASWLAEQLTAAGLEVVAVDVVPDDRARIVEALRRLAGESALIVCTGGLGPTTDDITSESVAALLGVPLERDPASLDAIARRMARTGRQMAVSNEKQADFPRGAEILPNAEGTAPGFAASLGAARAYCMPGVPLEMKAMFLAQIAPRLQALPGARTRQVRLHSFGLPESTVNDRLAGVEAEAGVTLGYRAHFPEIEVKVLARDADPLQAERRSEVGARLVRERLGDTLFGEGDTTLAEAVGALLLTRGWRLGSAESCTGGLVAELLTERAGASRFFAGGVVCYSNALKQALLGIPAALLEEYGAVSEPVARAMAERALGVLGVELAVAVTGVAGPDGGTEDKPVGLVWVAVATAEGCTADRRVFPASRERVQRLSAFRALDLARRVLLHGHRPPPREVGTTP